MTTDTSEKGLERLICTALTGAPCDPPQGGMVHERPAGYGVGWICGDTRDYDREYCVDLAQFRAFLHATQPVAADSLDLGRDSPTRRKFLARLQGEVTRRGTIDVLRKGVKHGPHQIDLMYGTPSPGNEKAKVQYGQNRFSVTRQLHYSQDQTQLALDLCLFINGLPVATFELKNSLTKQTVDDAVEQYKRDRNPREKLFELGRCLVHFAVDDHEVQFCTHLKGKASWFLPFNQGWNDGKGNPPNPNGLKTDYLWKQVLTRDGLTDIIENYAQIVETRDDKTGRKRREQIWPRYHQLDVVRRLLGDVPGRGVGPRYLIQHSAGSGKSNSIAWLAHQLIGLEQDGKALFDSAIVVTDRRILDKQIRDTIRQFAQVGSVVGHAETSGRLRTLLQEGKRIVITTVQKFPFILDAIGDEHRGSKFAIIIDEAHSSQGGRTSASVSMALGEAGSEEEGRDHRGQDQPADGEQEAAAQRQLLRLHRHPQEQDPGNLRRPVAGRREHQASPIPRLHHEGNPGRLHHRRAGALHAGRQLLSSGQDGGGRPGVRYQAGRKEAAPLRGGPRARHPPEGGDYGRSLPRAGCWLAENRRQGAGDGGDEQHPAGHQLLLRHPGLPGGAQESYLAIAAFSGEHEYDGTKVTEVSLNGFASNLIADKIQEEPYRFLVCADKFQTGYDEPLLHTMYVDKPLSGVKAVQTLSRLNRAHPKKHDAFVLDFANDADAIQAAFADYYRTTVLAEETDPDRLHDLKAALDGYQVYGPAQVDELVERYLSGADRDQLDPILDGCVSGYREQLDEDGQVDFKGKAKAFLRAYGFLATILPYTYAEWEKLSIFLTFLVPKLPAPIEDDLSKGILEAIDMDSYRVEKQAVQDIQLPDEDAEIGPVPTEGGGQKPEPEMDRLSNIVRDFNDRFGNIEWKDQDKIEKVIAEELPMKVAGDKAYQNARANSDRQNARIEHDKALERAMTELLADHTELFKQFSDNDSFRRWLSETVFAATYEEGKAGART